MSAPDRSPNLLAWQWNGYSDYHGSRTNLVLHLLTWPLFVSGFFTLLTSPLDGTIPGFIARFGGGITFMILAMVVQGRGHRMEKNAPIPFAGPVDVIGRILLEQLVNFPRFVLTGGLAKAWRAAA